MNKILVGLNILLLAVVAFFCYNNYSKTKPVFSSNVINKNNKTDSILNQTKIAYIELDSLNENILYFKQKRKELELQQKNVETEITNDYKNLEAKQNNFVQKNPNATPEEVQKIRQQLAQGQQDVENKKQTQSQQLSQKSFALMENIQKKLKDFLAEYNKDKKYQLILTTGSGVDYLILKDSSLDITKDVVRGMNEKLKGTTN